MYQILVINNNKLFHILGDDVHGFDLITNLVQFAILRTELRRKKFRLPLCRIFT